jgi:hypothetical protein
MENSMVGILCIRMNIEFLSWVKPHKKGTKVEWRKIEMN